METVSYFVESKDGYIAEAYDVPIDKFKFWWRLLDKKTIQSAVVEGCEGMWLWLKRQRQWTPIFNY